MLSGFELHRLRNNSLCELSGEIKKAFSGEVVLRQVLKDGLELSSRSKSLAPTGREKGRETNKKRT